jgi:predicted MFS family arabinose efflux permease
MLVVGGMFSMFFFLTQFLQGVDGYDALQAGLAFLPMTAVMFATGRSVPRLAARFGEGRLLLGGLMLAVAGLAWLSRIGAGTGYFPHVAVPLALVGTGIGLAFVPLTAAGVAGVAERDAGAASGLLNVSQQLGASLGLGILVTVFMSARHDLAGAPHAQVLAHGVATALTGSTVFVALALLVALLTLRRPAASV